jgi:hypothetical protein
MATPNLDNMSLEQLEHILNSQQDELAKLDAELAYIEQMENKMNEEQGQAPEQQAAAPVMPMDEFGMGLTPDAVQQATAKLVEAGIFTATTSELTQELVADLQAVANLLAPGLYDLSQPDQLEEFINGINDGTIPITPAAPAPAPAAGAAPAGAGIPVPGAGIPAGAGAIPAGAGAGAGAAPAPII